MSLPHDHYHGYLSCPINHGSSGFKNWVDQLYYPLVYYA